MTGIERTHLVTSRALDYLTPSALVAEIGHEQADWPLVVLKELVDNALDAAEQAGLPPVVSVAVGEDGITVSDNGPGIPDHVVERVVDLDMRVSSRAGYVAPDRGAQGNALKTMIAIPVVLDGERGEVEIQGHGVRHRVTVTLDRVRRQPRIDHQRDDLGRNGSLVRVGWPGRASSLHDAEWRFLQVALDFALFNPHLRLQIDWFGKQVEFPVSCPQFRKWTPSNPTSAHWYTVDDLAGLVVGYLDADAHTGRLRMVRELVGEFHGLTSTVKQKAILAATGLARVPLSALVGQDGLDQERVSALLIAMQQYSRLVKPTALGLIGYDHLSQMLAGMGGDPDTFRYSKKLGGAGGLPYVVEAAFAAATDDIARYLACGINWSPAWVNPFRDLGDGSGLDGLLREQRCGPEEPILVVLHLARPRPHYTDRGKSTVALGETEAEAITSALVSVTKQWAKQRKAEERDASRQMRRHDALTSRRRVTVKDAAWQVMRSAYLKASSDNSLPAHARQIMYAARGRVQELTGTLDDQYFTQTLLPDYLATHQEETRDWDVVFDARGHFEEPHTGTVVPLGTLDVRAYLASLYAPADGQAGPT